MAHQDKGHYAQKHQGIKIDNAISDLIKKRSENDQLSCSSAHKIAKELNISPSAIGIQADLMEYRIIQCQLGLFGYQPEKKTIDPNIDIPHALEERIDNTHDDGRLSCKECWEIASDLKVKRLDMGSSCEKKEIRIKPCQLGAF